MGHHQVGEQVEKVDHQHLRGIVLGVSGETPENPEDLLLVVTRDSRHKLEVVILLRYSDIALDSLGSHLRPRSEGHRQLVDLVVKARQVGADIVAEHGQRLGVDGQPLPGDKSRDGRGDHLL